jgi:hypothetical protein
MHLNLSVQEAVSSKLALYLDFVHRLFMLLASEYVALPGVKAGLSQYFVGGEGLFYYSVSRWTVLC